MTSNNNVPSIKFGPNKTAKQFYVKLFLLCTCLIVLAVLCSLILVWQFPQVQKSIENYFNPPAAVVTESTPAPVLQPKVKNVDQRNSTTTAAPAVSKASSERNDMDPYFNPSDMHTDDLLPSSSDRSSDVIDPETSILSVMTSAKDAEHEIDNANDVQGIVTKVTGLKVKRIDVLRGNDIVTKTRLGKVKGIAGEVVGQQVNAFLGIPYTAEVPIGDRRFTRSTKRTKPWQGILNVQSFKPHCPQVFHDDVVDKRTILVHEFSEDCLYLNIWSPGSSTRSSGSRQPIFPKVSRTGDGGSSSGSRRKSPTAPLKPVMMWMFGGGYSGGSNNLDEMDGRVLAALGDVVVVTFNYRVGSLGFLDMGIDDAPGNMGLYDAISGEENRLLLMKKFFFHTPSLKQTYDNNIFIFLDSNSIREGEHRFLRRGSE
jgi:hypothetical protein